MKPTPQNAVDASVRLLNAANDQLAITEIMTNQVMDILDQPASEYGVTHAGNAPLSDLVYISPAQRRRILFLIGEVESRCATVYELANKHADAQCLPEPAQEANSELGDIISKWQEAHAKWREQLDIGDESDSPQSKAEDIAAEALLTFQCRTHTEVQRKISLFAGNDHLASLGASYSDTFFPSLIVAVGRQD